MKCTWGFGSILFSLQACSPVDVVIHQSDDASGGSGAQPSAAGGGSSDPIEYELGGARAETGGGTGGETDPPPIVDYTLDDFEDGDTRALPPAEWWYTVNDGTSEQTLRVIDQEEAPVPPRPSSGFILETSSGAFTDWGSALGVDIVGFDFPQGGLEISFQMAASRPVQLSLHALDATNNHFSRDFSVDTSWETITIRLDNLFLVQDGTVLRFDTTSADEIQWFVFEAEPVTLWLDDVTLRTF